MGRDFLWSTAHVHCNTMYKCSNALFCGLIPMLSSLDTGASPLTYHLTSLLLTKAVFEERDVFFHLYNHPDHLPTIHGVAMELTDMAHFHLARVICTSSLQEAFKAVSASFILDMAPPNCIHGPSTPSRLQLIP